MGKNYPYSTGTASCRRGRPRFLALFSATLVALGLAAQSQAEIFVFRTVQGNPPSTLPGVTLNVHQGPGNTVDFTFVNICGASMTGRIKEVSFSDPCSPKTIVAASGVVGPENTPGCSQPSSGFDACNGSTPCVSYVAGGSLPVNFECPFTTDAIFQPVSTEACIDKGERLTIRFTLNLQSGETPSAALSRLLACMMHAQFSPCVSGFRVALKFQGTDPGGGGPTAVNYPDAFPPEDCNQNGIPDVCDMSCTGFGGRCSIFRCTPSSGTCDLCGHFPNGFGLVAPTNLTASVNPICPGTSTTVKATSAGNTIEWFAGSCASTLEPLFTSASDQFVSTGTLTQTTTFYARAKNAGGCTGPCASITINAGDTQAPTISGCPANINVNTETGRCTATVSWTPPTASDNCPPVTLTSNHNPGETFAKGTTTVTYTARDTAGNTQTCSFTVTVVDNQAPQISGLPGDITVNTETGRCTAVVSWTTPTVSDNCTGATLSSNHNPGETFPKGTSTVTYTATDASGRTTTRSFTVTVNDHEIPSLRCPPAITINTDIGRSTAHVTWTAPTSADVTDNCSGPYTIVRVDTGPGSPGNSGDFPIGSSTVTYQVTDASGNVGTCTFTVTVIDREKPNISCPSPINLNAETDRCGANVSWTAPTATDNSGAPVNVVRTDTGPGSPDNAGFFPVGTTTVTYTATDHSGNTATCSFTVTVTDNQPPVVVGCPISRTVSTDTNACGATVTWTEPTVTDNCPNATLARTDSGPANGGQFPLGQTTVTYLATDASGKTATCSFTIGVEDNQDPTVVSCPENITVTNQEGHCSATVSWTEPTCHDNCPGCSITRTMGPGPGSTFPVGVTTIEYTASDAHGRNSTACAFTVTVIDGDGDEDGVSNCNDHCPGTTSGPVDADGCNCAQEHAQESPLDSDGDGVPDACDRCPGSPQGVPVDVDGCTCTQNAMRGGAADADGDGVPDSCDECPGTPAGTAVDPMGCSCAQARAQQHPLDNDGDGVPDICDLCPSTPRGEAVDSNGCSCSQKDDDDDGVNNCNDQCPGTPSGQTVNAAGCSCSQLDDDGDGVNNCDDQCPDTPAGTLVDAAGCPPPPLPQPCDQLDDDGDGVNNCIDQCPNTPAGSAVDATGCAACDPSKNLRVDVVLSSGWLSPVCGSGCPMFMAAAICGLLTIRTGVRSRRRHRRIES